MNNLNDLKAIWLSADTTALPTPDEIVRMGKKFRNQKLRRKCAMIVLSILLSGLMLTNMLIINSKMLTTQIGEVLLIISCVIIATTNLRSIKRFYELNDYNNADFIAFLERTKQNQTYFYEKTQIVAMGLSSVGLMLYWYEMVYNQPVKAIIAYSIMACYLAFLWLYVRPRMFKKRQKKLDEMIAQLEKISKQF